MPSPILKVQKYVYDAQSPRCERRAESAGKQQPEHGNKIGQHHLLQSDLDTETMHVRTRIDQFVNICHRLVHSQQQAASKLGSSMREMKEK